VGKEIVKIVKRRWTISVCLFTLASNVIGVGLFVFLVLQPEILSQEFVSFVETQDWWNTIGLQLGQLTVGMNVGQMVCISLVILVTFSFLIDSIVAIAKTVKSTGTLRRARELIN